jgi:hypothetical protein
MNVFKHSEPILISLLIGCTILHAVSGILRTHRGRRGSGLRRHLAGVNAPRRAGAAGLDSVSSALATGQCGHSPGLCGLALRLCGPYPASILANVALLAHWLGCANTTSVCAASLLARAAYLFARVAHLSLTWLA